MNDMKRAIPWIIAAACAVLAMWAVGTRHSIGRRVADRLARQEDQIARLHKQRRADEQLRATHAAAERVLAQQEERLHQIHDKLHPFTLSRTNMMLGPVFEMEVAPHLRGADVTVTIGNASTDKAWLPPRYKIGFLNADGFVSGELDSGVFNTWVQPGTNLTHQYQVGFSFGEPVYYTMKTMRQGSRNP
jgi:hypothetical protein